MERHFASWGNGGARDRRPAPRRARRRASPRTATSRAAHVPVRRELRDRALGLGAGALPRGALRRGPAARARADRGRLREGLPPRARACSTRTTTRRWRSSGATSTSSARCARCSASASRGARGRRSATCAASSAPTSAGCARRACDGPELVRPLAHLGASPCRPHGRLDHRHARGPPARAAAAARSRSRGATRSRRTRCPGACSTPARRRIDRNWPWEFVRTRLPAAAARARGPRRATTGGPLTIAWVVPPWSVGSGGHTTIFRLVRQMEQRGHRCSIHLFDPGGPRARARAASCARRSASTSWRWTRRCFATSSASAARTSRSPPSGAPPSPCATCPAAARRSTSSRTTSRSSTPPRRSRSGPRRATAWATAASPTRPGWRTSCATSGGSRRTTSSAAPTRTCTSSRARRAGSRSSSRSTRAGRRSGARSSSRSPALATAFERRPSLRVVAFGSNLGVTAPFPLEDLRRAAAARACRRCTGARARAWSSRSRPTRSWRTR